GVARERAAPVAGRAHLVVDGCLGVAPDDAPDRAGLLARGARVRSRGADREPIRGAAGDRRAAAAASRVACAHLAVLESRPAAASRRVARGRLPGRDNRGGATARGSGWPAGTWCVP